MKSLLLVSLYHRPPEKAIYRTAAFSFPDFSVASPNAAFSAQVQIPSFGAPRRNRRGAARAPHCAKRNAAAGAAKPPLPAVHGFAVNSGACRAPLG